MDCQVELYLDDAQKHYFEKIFEQISHKIQSLYIYKNEDTLNGRQNIAGETSGILRLKKRIWIGINPYPGTDDGDVIRALTNVAQEKHEKKYGKPWNVFDEPPEVPIRIGAYTTINQDDEINVSKLFIIGKVPWE